MNTKYKIEKGVAPGPKKSRFAVFGDIVDRLSGDDSLVVNTQEEANHFRAVCYGRGYTMIQRKEADGRFRLWKGAKRS